jgi:hypothetical protein
MENCKVRGCYITNYKEGGYDICPFHEGEYGMCNHPAALRKDGGVGVEYDMPPPADCPLRKEPITIELDK